MNCARPRVAVWGVAEDGNAERDAALRGAVRVLSDEIAASVG